MNSWNLRPQKAAQVLFFILGSGWFTPVSFVAGVFIGFYGMEEIMAWRGGPSGQPYYSLFFVLAETKNGIEPVQLRRLEHFLAENPEASLLLSTSQGKVTNYDNWDYTLIKSETEVKVTVSYLDDDYASKSIYRVEKKNTITPLYSSVSGMPNILFGLIFGLIFAKFIRFFFMYAYATCTRAINAEQRKL
jgi:hypothetical protein